MGMFEITVRSSSTVVSMANTALRSEIKNNIVVTIIGISSQNCGSTWLVETGKAGPCFRSRKHCGCTHTCVAGAPLQERRGKEAFQVPRDLATKLDLQPGPDERIKHKDQSNIRIDLYCKLLGYFKKKKLNQQKNLWIFALLRFLHTNKHFSPLATGYHTGEVNAYTSFFWHLHNLKELQMRLLVPVSFANSVGPQ